MNPEFIANVFWNVLALLALYVVVYKVYVNTLQAEYRHELLALRRELFLLMAKGHVNHSDPAYQVLRRLLNGLLRRAEEITGLQVLIISLASLRDEARSGEGLEQNLDRTVQSKELRDIRRRIDQATARHIARLIPVSPSLMGGFVLSVLITCLVGVLSVFASKNHSTMAKPIVVTKRVARSPRKMVVRGLTADALGVVQAA